ncbi:hypothetical protein ACMC5R_03860 [Deferribacteres bacterium DY0037]
MNTQPNDMTFAKNLYSLEAIQRTIYDLPHMSPSLSETEDSYIIIFGSSTHASPVDIEQFQKSLTDHQVRLDLENRFSPIRNLLVAKAVESSLDVRPFIKKLSESNDAE